ncbi:VOC family protein [Leucobacter chromiireducens]|uniref:VOC family protein n=1 Tax=Leucobacter chromiireducens subsp. solipictus TaxID=398235 RepID=A0ABS1SC50_9MICO|nr:VOC family protein [Leucobacter chromiireducens]MBL3678124.1 VOC family protein [Leucobacter chromiireducens subsp. solipictus]
MAPTTQPTAPTLQRIVPNIWCVGTAAEAGAFYAAALPHTSFEIESRYPMSGLLDFQEPFAGEPLTVAVDVWGTRLVLINAGGEFRPNPALSLMLNFDPLFFADAGDDAAQAAAARAALERSWAALSAGGRVLMPLAEYPFSPCYGWVEDRYGVSWQLILTNPEGDPRPFVMPSLMFGGAAQNRASEAVAFYTEVLADAAPGTRVPYGQETGPATPESIMFGEFRVGGPGPDAQWFTAMDSGVPQDFTFTPGMSLEVRCPDQAEIDRLWDALSAVPEAEACGWLTDRFGVSWQIVPENIGELMEHPGAFERMLTMKKLIIAEL